MFYRADRDQELRNPTSEFSPSWIPGNAWLRIDSTTEVPAHTDSDISVYFTEADILQVGDTFWNREYPFIDYATGGSIDGQIRAAEANLAKVTDKTIVIPGHGAVGGKADLVLFRDVLVEIREKVAAVKKQGMSLNEVVAAKPGARYDAEWGSLFQNPSAFLSPSSTRVFDNNAWPPSR